MGFEPTISVFGPTHSVFGPTHLVFGPTLSVFGPTHLVYGCTYSYFHVNSVSLQMFSFQMTDVIPLLEKRILHLERNVGNVWILGNVSLAPREELFNAAIGFLNSYVTKEDINQSLLSTRHGGKLKNGEFTIMFIPFILIAYKLYFKTFHVYFL